MRKIATVILAMAAGVAMAQKPEGPLWEGAIGLYHGTMEGGMALCYFVNKNEMLGGAPSSAADGAPRTTGECVSKFRADGKKLLDSALKGIKKPAAQAALKSTHVAYVTALEGLAPESGERVISYDQRQARLKEEITKAWAKFEIEL